ncbi:MAG: L-lactate permease [Clostridiales Family XIII bacterium]|nr:L-lactate permease [Clostridiales Family XIII bacterium]
MEVPITFAFWIIAAMPIVIILLLMLKYRWGVSEAGAVAVLITAASAMLVFKADIFLIASESAKGIWNSFFVLLIVWPAILIYEVTAEARAFQVIQLGMDAYTPNELLKILAFGWVFASFFQGITGFGVPVAVCAPLLVGMGVVPVWAVVVPLLGHAWANTFGTLSVAWIALIDQTGLSGVSIEQTAFWAALFLWIFNFLGGVTLCWFYGGRAGVRKGLPAVVVISLIQGGGQMLISRFNQTVAAFIPTSFALATVFLFGRSKFYGKKWRIEKSPIMANRAEAPIGDGESLGLKLNQAFMPYYVLAIITILVLMVPEINRFLKELKVGLPFEGTETGYGVVNAASAAYSAFSPFVHSGTLLFTAALIGYCFFRYKKRIKAGGTLTILLRSVEKTVPSMLAVSELLIMSKIMSGTGQTLILASGVALVMGDFYALCAPAVGVLGAFITSSNMSSNILFAEFQQITASITGMPGEPLLGAQTAGGAIGNTVAPGNVILGTTTTGIVGSEGTVLKKIFPIALLSAAVCGIILWLHLAIFTN